MYGRGVDAGDEAKIEQQKPGVGPRREQRFHLLIEPVGRPEEQIALQAHALDLAAMHRKDRKLARLAVERGAVFRAIEAELDRIYPARAHGERREADDHADEHAGDEADLEDEQGDGEEGDVRASG